MNINTRSIKDTFLNFLVPIVAILGSGLLFIFWIYPSITNLPLLRAEVTEKRNLEVQLKDKLAHLNDLLDFKSVVDENSELINSVLVSEPNVPILLTQIDQLATEAGLSVNKLSYSFGEISAGEGIVTPYDSVTVSLGVLGSYSQIEQFLVNIEDSARIIDVISLRYSISVDAEGNDKLSASIVLTSPFLEVQSNAVTDDPVNINVSDEEFVVLINKLKGLRYLNTQVPSAIVETAVEEVPGEEDAEVEDAIPEGTSAEDTTPPADEPLPEEIVELIEESQNPEDESLPSDESTPEEPTPTE